MTTPRFDSRARGEEWMDDFSISDARLARALDDLDRANRWLGGVAATRRVLAPLLAQQRRLTVLDLGAGRGDLAGDLVRWAERHEAEIRVTALDANPATVDYARAHLDQELPAPLRSRVEVVVGDAFHLEKTQRHDVVHASLFLHHFDDPGVVRLLGGMQAAARLGIIVNDLHRHPLAYYGVRVGGRLLGASPMFRHDGPLSVLRGFRRAELSTLARRAGLATPRLRWHWAFRWTLDTLMLPAP